MPFAFLKAYPTGRVALAIACALFPFGVYSGAFWFIGGSGFFPEPLAGDDLGLSLKFTTPAEFAAELVMREAFFLTSVVMVIVTVAATAYALALVWRDRGPVWAAVTALGALLAGGVAAYYQSNPMREVVVQAPLALAIEMETTFGAAQLKHALDLFVTVNTFVGLAAVAAMISRLADIALGPQTGAQTDATAKRRAGALREAMLASSAILTAATIATHFYYHFPLTLMTTASAEIYRPLAHVATLRWGAAYTAILITAVGPAVAALLEDRRAGIEAGHLSEDLSGIGWMTRAGLAAKLRALGSVAALLAPAIASPALNLITEIIEKFAGS